MDTPIRMKINGLWKDVYCKKTVVGDTDEDIAGGDVYTLLTLMDIPLRQRAMEMYQAKRNLVQPAIASADFYVRPCFIGRGTRVDTTSGFSLNNRYPLYLESRGDIFIYRLAGCLRISV